jgi:hypothetical protein
LNLPGFWGVFVVVFVLVAIFVVIIELIFVFDVVVQIVVVQAKECLSELSAVGTVHQPTSEVGFAVATGFASGAGFALGGG